MLKRIVFIAFGLLVSMILLVSCSSSASPSTSSSPTASSAAQSKAPEQKIYKWTAQSIAAVGNPDHESLVDYCKTVEKCAGGRIQINVLPAPTICAPADVLNAIGRGVLDLGFVAPGYLGGKLAWTYVDGGLPMDPRDAEEFWLFWIKSPFRDFVVEKYKAMNAYPLPPWSGNDCMFISKKAIRTLDDFKGFKLRTYGPFATFFQKLGCSTVYVSGEEIYTGLQLGTFDGATWGAESTFYAFKLHEVAKYLIYPNFNYGNADYPMIRLDIWNELPEDLKNIMITVAERHVLWSQVNEHNMDRDAIKEMTGKWGVQQVTVDAPTYQKMREAAMQVWDEIGAKDADAAKAISLLKDFMAEREKVKKVLGTW